MSRSPAVTSLDVARVAGVSQSAVSRAFTPGASVSPQTRARILATARELGYEPRTMVRSVGTARPAEIAIVMADINNPFFPAVLDTLMRRLQERSLPARLHGVPRGVSVDTIIPDLFRAPPAGVIFSSAVLSPHLTDVCRQRRLPIVLLNRFLPRSGLSMVVCDNYAGGRQVADLLVGTGRNRIAFIAGHEDIPSSAERERGLTDALAAADVELFARAVGNFVYEGGLEATRHLLAQRPRPDAIFCANDVMALAAIDVVAREAGLRIPDDISIVGFDGIPMASWPAFRLTTVHQRIETMIEEAIDLLLRLIAFPETAGVTRLVAGTLVERGTTLPATGIAGVASDTARRTGT